MCAPPGESAPRSILIRQGHSKACHQSSVYLELGARTEARPLAGEKCHDLGHFLRSADAAKRLRITPLADRLLLLARRSFACREMRHRRIDAAWANSIGANASATEIDGDGTCQRHHAASRGS